MNGGVPIPVVWFRCPHCLLLFCVDEAGAPLGGFKASVCPRCNHPAPPIGGFGS